MLALSEIRYVEVQDHDLLYHMKNGNILTRGPLSEVEARLDPGRFFRCNKYCLVNLSYVDSFQNNDILIGEDHIQVSRARKKAMLDALNNYLNEVCK